MAAIGEFLRPKLPENMEFSVDSSTELHVLAVDDSLVDRKVIERLLKISSCKVTAVESGTRALQYLGLDGEKNSVGINGLKVNLIITDYSMPGMTGYELLKKIKESSAFKEVPVVIMSSENIMTRIDRCLEEGAEEFILKPVKLSDVKRLKSSLIKGEGKESDENIVEEVKLQDDTNSIKTQSGIEKTVEKRKSQGDMNPITSLQDSCNVAGPQEHHPESPLLPNRALKRTKLQTTN